MFGAGVRNPDADYLTRVISRMDSATGGHQVGLAEIARAKGFDPDDPEYNGMQTLGFLLDMIEQ
jgi:hypothetical protein